MRVRALRESGFEPRLLLRHEDPRALLANGGGMETILPELTPDDLATVLFTSGSTGMAKGAYSDHRGVVQGTMNYVCQSAAMLGILTARGEGPAEGSQPVTLVNALTRAACVVGAA